MSMAPARQDDAAPRPRATSEDAQRESGALSRSLAFDRACGQRREHPSSRLAWPQGRRAWDHKKLRQLQSPRAESAPTMTFAEPVYETGELVQPRSTQATGRQKPTS
eukprot:Amastigsp_a694144_5.p4 type:complete len:107 gc:universal Amastigsp_a694144_5:396-76(-)